MNNFIVDAQKKEAGMSKTVIIWGREDMLGRGVGVCLNAKKGWEVIRITDKYGESFLLQEVERVKPDVVIVYQGDCASETDIPEHLIRRCPKLKVITISLENNSIEIYNKQKVMVREVADLFSIVEA